MKKTLKSALKSLPNEEAQGKLQPIRFLNLWSFSSGARETSISFTSRAARWIAFGSRLSAIDEQTGQPTS